MSTAAALNSAGRTIVLRRNESRLYFRHRCEDLPVVPVIPAHCEGKTPVYKSLGQLDVTSGNWKVGDHLAEGDHH